jgi:hypothetical protein
MSASWLSSECLCTMLQQALNLSRTNALLCSSMLPSCSAEYARVAGRCHDRCGTEPQPEPQPEAMTACCCASPEEHVGDEHARVTTCMQLAAAAEAAAAAAESTTLLLPIHTVLPAIHCNNDCSLSPATSSQLLSGFQAVKCCGAIHDMVFG